MITFKTYKKSLITELFDKPVPWKHVNTLEHSSTLIVTYSFQVNQKPYNVSFISYSVSKTSIELEFTLEDKEKGGDDGIGISNTGDQFVVFSTVLDITKSFVKKYPNVDEIFFTAALNEPSRVSLYKKMVQKLVPSGWSVDSKESRRDLKFILRKH